MFLKFQITNYILLLYMAEDRPPFIPQQESTYEFISFIQDHTPFLREYLDNLKTDNYITSDDHDYYNSLIDICNNIDTDEGDDGTFERYRATLEPLMEWMSEEVDEQEEEDTRNALAGIDRRQAGPTGVASRTRSKRPATEFEIPPSKRGTNMITLEPTKQEGVRIKLSDGKEYTYNEIKSMWQFSKDQTPLRHPYTEEDKQKINELIDLATKGGKRRTRKGKKGRKNKTRNSKTKKSKTKRTLKR